HVEAGLHDKLERDPDLVAAAAAAGLELRDLRRVPDGLSTPSGAGLGVQARIVHTVGTDCAIGKMTVTLELAAAARAAGQLVNAIVPYAAKPVPVVATVAEAAALGAQCLAIGVAPTGGKLPPAWKAALLEALALGLHVEAGLHDKLAGDPDLVAAAAAGKLELRDLRRVPEGLSTPSGAGLGVPARIVHTVGTDCAIGKMTVTLELAAAAQAAGENAVFVPTGQIGISIAGWGIAVDDVVSDYVAGAAEALVLEGAERGDLLLVEGQGAILHPLYSGVTLGLLHGSTPHALVLVHEAGATRIDLEDRGGPPGPLIPPLPELADLLLRLTSPIRPAPVVAIALSTRTIASDAEAQAAIAAVEAETGLVCDDPVRFGADRLWQAVAKALA
ncbi:MAG: hypothetical protein QOK36_3488, partial [Gaiellales bacterium]|nr:hypothetical protein [Gaiellales bacterium]